SLMLLDVDRFKTINDTHGHQFGDRVLKAITSTLKRQLKHKEAMIARWGGEEFIILAQGYRLTQALELAERLRAAIEGMEFENIPITSSFGVTEFSPEDELDTLVRRADLALYTAKESGRNRIISY
ncbi:MAG: GGDEF domain-containing protein, partial [Wolinella sp.]